MRIDFFSVAPAATLSRYTLATECRRPEPVFPRSRFQERLAKSVTLERKAFPHIESPNPFNEEQDAKQNAPETRPRRKKKRAPRPPEFDTVISELHKTNVYEY